MKDVYYDAIARKDSPKRSEVDLVKGKQPDYHTELPKGKYDFKTGKPLDKVARQEKESVFPERKKLKKSVDNLISAIGKGIPSYQNVEMNKKILTNTAKKRMAEEKNRKMGMVDPSKLERPSPTDMRSAPVSKSESPESKMLRSKAIKSIQKAMGDLEEFAKVESIKKQTAMVAPSFPVSIAKEDNISKTLDELKAENEELKKQVNELSKMIKASSDEEMEKLKESAKFWRDVEANKKFEIRQKVSNPDSKHYNPKHPLYDHELDFKSFNNLEKAVAEPLTGKLNPPTERKSVTDAGGTSNINNPTTADTNTLQPSKTLNTP